MESVAFSVVGVPQTMGSAKTVPTRANWRSIPGVRWKVVRDGDQAIADWQKKIKTVAQAEMWEEEPMTGPLVVQMTFALPRPQGHFGTGRNAGVVRAGAAEFPDVQKNDLDKLLRAACDPLSDVVYVDDGQIVNLHGWKRYGKPGVQITVSRIGAT